MRFMNINYKQPQLELFPAKSSTLEDVNKPRFLLASLTLSLESLVILSILGIMVALFSFCLGIERGKHLVAQAMDQRVSAAWNITVKKPLPRTFIPAAAAKPRAGQASPASSGAGTRFTVQVSSYKNEGFARTEARALLAKGYKAFLIKTGDFILVCVGQFSSNEAAGAALKKLPPHYRPGLVRRF